MQIQVYGICFFSTDINIILSSKNTIQFQGMYKKDIPISVINNVLANQIVFNNKLIKKRNGLEKLNLTTNYEYKYEAAINILKPLFIKKNIDNF
jgi:hypothetical protein